MKSVLPGGVIKKKFYKGRLRPELQPLTLLYTVLNRKVPLSHVLLTNGTPFTSLVFLSAVNAQSLKYQNTKPRFLELFSDIKCIS